MPMKYKVYSSRDFEKILRKNGYVLNRFTGSHSVWLKEGLRPISVPQSLNPMIIRRLIKENNLIEEK